MIDARRSLRAICEILGFLAFGDVEDDPLDHPWVAALVVDGPCQLQDPLDRAVLVHHPVLVAHRLIV